MFGNNLYKLLKRLVLQQRYFKEINSFIENDAFIRDSIYKIS